MKYFNIFAKYSLAMFAIALMTACSGNNDSTKENSASAKLVKADGSALTVRYIDKDSLLRNYSLAKDLNEASLRLSNKLEAAQRQKGAEIQKFAATVQNKYQSNGYLSEASFNADQQKLQKMQMEAESYMASLQRSAQNELLQNQIQLNDSVENFLKEYNKEKGYDIILDKAATFIINPAFDITDEIIKGLNARYNKVEPKK